MSPRCRFCCQGIVLGSVLILCLQKFVLNTAFLKSKLSLVEHPQEHYPTRLYVLPVMGTSSARDTQDSILNCTHIPKEKEEWKEYREKVIHDSKEDQKLLNEGKKTVPDNVQDLYECSVEVELSPCSCTRTITVRLPEPCPSTSPEQLLQHIKTTLGESTCSDAATLRGTGQKVVSYSVAGRPPNDYVYGLTQVTPDVRERYPGWIMRIYTDNSTEPHKWMCYLACHHPYLDFCDITQLPTLGDVTGSSPRVWRYSVIGDPLVSLYMLRDADSPILQREVDAVAHWLKSGTCYHGMRDHPFHGVTMMGGMWGGCNDNYNTKIAALAAREVSLCGSKSSDQTILDRVLWPIARTNGTFHDSYTCRRFPDSQPFPTQRRDYTFVGQRSYRTRFRHDTLRKKCPESCRPKEHQNWEYC